MAITFDTTNNDSNSRSTSGTDASVTHTVIANTSLLVVTTMMEAGTAVTGTPQWQPDGGTNVNLVLVHATTASGSNNDVALVTYALADPEADTGTVSVTHESNDNFITTAVNYLGTNNSATMSENIALIEQVVNDGGGSTTVFASGGTAGSTLYVAGVFKGGDGDGNTPPSPFGEIFDGASGTNANADIAG